MKIAAVFSDNMVLQRYRNIRIFGTCTDSEKEITVTLYAYGLTLPANAVINDGKWEAVLPPVKECDHCTLEVSCGTEKRVFKNVAIGEVWLAGGQSNMEFELHNDKNGAKELAECSAENVRYYYTPKCPIMSELDEAEKDTGWTVASAENSQAWSAVGYYFAKELSRKLGVTVGIIGCNWGGTSASAWMSRQYLEQDSRLRPYIDEYDNAIKDKTAEEMFAEYDEYCKYQENWQNNVNACFAEDPNMEWDKVLERCGENRFPGPMGIKNPMRPCGLYDTMVRRIAPYTMAGVLWYQGESDDHRPHTYEFLLKALIENWRTLWKDCGLPFMIVQLPMFRYEDIPDSKSWAYIREAQENVYLSVRNTGIAYALDCGELNNIHPTDKAPVGHRLYLQAMSEVYGLMERSETLPPLYDSYEVRRGKMLIKLKNCKRLSGKDDNCLDGFEIAGADGVYFPAKATVKIPYIELECDEVKLPVSARFKWTNYAQVGLFGLNDLPLPPFRTDKTIN